MNDFDPKAFHEMEASAACAEHGVVACNECSGVSTNDPSPRPPTEWRIARIAESRDGLRVDFERGEGPTAQRVSGFFNRWSEPPHTGIPFTAFAQSDAGRAKEILNGK